MKLYTGRINYTDPDKLVLNTSFKTGSGLGLFFAPTKALVYASKYGDMSWREYTKKYTQMMRNRWLEDSEKFRELLEHDEVVITCYCADTHDSTRHCHRYILADILEKVAEHLEIPFEQAGEVK